MRNLKLISKLLINLESGFYINYEEFKGVFIRLSFHFFYSFILTMRNLKSLYILDNYQFPIGFILTMRNLKLGDIIITAFVYVVLY